MVIQQTLLCFYSYLSEATYRIGNLFRMSVSRDGDVDTANTHDKKTKCSYCEKELGGETRECLECTELFCVSGECAFVCECGKSTMCVECESDVLNCCAYCEARFCKNGPCDGGKLVYLPDANGVSGNLGHEFCQDCIEYNFEELDLDDPNSVSKCIRCKLFFAFEDIMMQCVECKNWFCENCDNEIQTIAPEDAFDKDGGLKDPSRFYFCEDCVR